MTDWTIHPGGAGLRCPFCDEPAGGLPPPGTFCLCIHCGYTVVVDAAGFQAVGEVPAVVEHRLDRVRELLRERRRRQGFTTPARCPACTGHIESVGLLPHARIICEGCLTVFVADGHELRAPRPGELHAEELRRIEFARHMVQSRRSPQ